MKRFVHLVTRGILLVLMTSLVACPGNPGGGNGSYRIELRYSTDFPPRFKPAFEAAAQRWQGIITADVPDVGGPIDVSRCVSEQSSLSFVDDLVIYAGIIPFDAGSPDLLGQAGPCYFRKTSFLTIVGTMAFVDNKMDGLLQANQLTDTVTHEMGHVLGIGTHWNNVPNIATGLSSDPTQCGANPEFIGSNAVREYRALGGTGNIPIENQGGPGTCDGHWKESIFGAELMTGVLNDGVPNPLSKITLGSMQDLGYSVDLSKANAYSISAFSGSTLRTRNQLIVTRPVERALP
jgi:Leishmanolysin